MNMYILQKSDEHFPEHEIFIPGRWMKGNEKDLSKVYPFAHLPFGFGAKACIGRRFAEMETFVALARILREFKLEHHGPLKYRPCLIFAPEDDSKYKFTDLEK